MSKKTNETLYIFSMIYAEAESNLGLFYQESHTKSSLDKENCTDDDILDRILDEMKVVALQTINGRLMLLRESDRFVFTEDLEGDSNYSLAVIPAEDEEQIPFAPNITEEAAFGHLPFWYDNSGFRKVSDFNGFVEEIGTDGEFFDEVREMGETKRFIFFPAYLCFETKEVDPATIISHHREVKVVVK